MVETGASAQVDFVADDATTAVALGSGDMLVLGTPKIVALCEEAAVASMIGGLDEGTTSVGIHISLDHLAPTAVGRSVEATAVVVGVEGRKVEFEVSVAEGDLEVARGTHTRFVVDRARFLGRLGAR